MLEQFTEIDNLHQDIFHCEKCSLADSRCFVTVKRGSNESKIFVVGETPREQEDISGIPFVGDSGGLLEKIFYSVGIVSKEVYLTNIVKCRPPENRKPSNEEIKACKPWLFQQLELVKPSILVLMGNTAYTGLVGNSWTNLENGTKETFGITKHRGKWFKSEWCDRTICTFHPTYLLYNWKLEEGSPKHLAWKDWMSIKKVYEDFCIEQEQL